MTGGHLGRRDLFRLAAGLVVLSACDAGPPAAAPGSPSPTPTTTPTPPPPTLAPSAPSLPPTPELAPYESWVPSASEPLPALKRTAADFVQALTVRGRGEGLQDTVARAAALSGLGFDPAAALAVAGPLGEGEVSTGEIVYAQFGGLSPDGRGAQQSSVMVLVRQRLLAAGGAQAEVVRAVDVRLAVQDGRWRVVQLSDAGGEPVDRPADLDPLSVAVLDNPALFLPDTARWDVHARRPSQELLTALVGTAGLVPVAVTVLHTGHPENVFGTDRVSPHRLGRAVDLWQVGGAAVVDQPATSGPAHDLLKALFADPTVSSLGSPDGSDQDGPPVQGRPTRSFTNLTHRDHLHVAVATPPPPPPPSPAVPQPELPTTPQPG